MSDDLAITSGGAIFRRLRQLGVDLVLVNSGTDFPPIIEGLAEADAHDVDVPRSIVVPHEHVAMGIAHGYYFGSGRAQAVMLHTNVGLANGAIGAINAANDQVPVILMSGRTPTVERGRFGARTVPIGWGQEMRDQAALVREACKWEYELRFPEQLPELLDRAYAIATSTPKGPVYLSLPREVLTEPCPVEELDAPIAMRAASVVASPDQIAEVAALLAGAEHPLIFAQRGAGSVEGFDALARIADRWSIPVCQYWAVANAISSEHPMYVGEDPAPWVADADVILVIDSLAPWMPDAHGPSSDCHVIQLGPDPLYSRSPVRNFRSDLSITSEVGGALVVLERAMSQLDTGTDESQRARRRALAEERNVARREQSCAAVDAGRIPMTKAWVSQCVGEAIRGHVATVVSELGCPYEQLGLTEHNAWRQEPHSGGLGWGFPCAMGIKLSDPERLVVATMGDGSYMFANPVACHHVAEAHNIAVLVVVLNNAGYGAVRHSVRDLYPTGYAAKADEMPLTGLSPSPDFTQVARACRAHAETVTDGSALPAALARAIHVVTVEHRQALLDVHVA
ncbi:MAG: thiamine pyrophosphate-requiring protein [Acidimicrobiales bacterium]